MSDQEDKQGLTEGGINLKVLWFSYTQMMITHPQRNLGASCAVGGGGCAAQDDSTETPLAAISSLSLSDEAPLRKSTLSLDEKVQVCLSVGEEVITPEELQRLFTAKEHPVVYDGFEPSGRMHIAQGVLRWGRLITFNRYRHLGS
jgi:hypothetical protein